MFFNIYFHQGTDGISLTFSWISQSAGSSYGSFLPCHTDDLRIEFSISGYMIVDPRILLGVLPSLRIDIPSLPHEIPSLFRVVQKKR